MVVAHWLSGRKGAYYKAWVGNAGDKEFPRIPSGRTPKEQEFRNEKLAELRDYFGIGVTSRAVTGAFSLAYVEKRGFTPGIYVCQIDKHQTPELTDTRVVRDPLIVWADVPSSDKYGFINLHRQFPDVFKRLMRNDVEIIAHRTLPWLFAVITAALLMVNCFWDVSGITSALTGQSEIETTISIAD